MKDGFRRFDIEPFEDTLDFMGPTQSSESVKLLEGIIRLSLTRPTKIRSIAVKFKGFGRVTIKAKSNNNVGLVTSMLPKLKCCISGKTLLPAGDHTIPWDIEIPNIYPPSLLIKRATIFYRVEVVISFALAKSISAEHPITLRRHLLPCKELAPLVETKIYEHTVPAKFHYEIEAPQIICLDQLAVPFAVKYLCIANQKAVQSIRTQLTQIELYRIQSISKTDADLTQISMDVYNLDKKVSDCKQRRDYAKFVKRTIPALIHSVDQSRSSAWKQPIVLRHKLHQFLQHSFDSPLVSVHHQLEVTFQFDHRFEDIKAKIPIIIASIPTSALLSTSSALSSLITSTNEPHNELSDTDSKYPFESVTRFESMAVVPEQPDRPIRRASEDLHSRACASTLVIDPPISIPRPKQKQPRKQQTTTDHPLWTSALRLPQSTTIILKNKVVAAAGTGKFFGGRKSSDGFSDKHRRPLLYMDNQDPSSFTASNLFGRRKSIKRYNSDYDLNALSTALNDIPEDRPRTATPQGDRRRRHLPPIDVELANGIKPKTLPRLVDKSTKNSASRFGNDKGMIKSGSSHDIPHGVDSDNYHSESSDEDDFDLQSVYSDMSISSPVAPTPSISATEASNFSQQTLLTRPPSPAFRPAPGLPANTALQSHLEQPMSLVEESFNYAAISSPVIATVASSILISPCNSTTSTTTTSTTRRRIALSSVSSIMNGDSTSFRSFGEHLPYQHGRNNSNVSAPGTHRTPYASALRESAALEPEDYDYGLSNDIMDETVDPKQHYLHAKLPPIPSTSSVSSGESKPALSTGAVIPRIKKRQNQETSSEFKVLNETKRMTRLYVDDSDDETLDPLPPIPEKQVSEGHAHAVLDNKIMPLLQLPRLSFGMALGDALGFNQFENAK